MYIEKINGPEDVKKIEVAELPKLAEEMRHALLIRASKHGGHFGPNFGMVEATIALHYVFDSPKDKIVFFCKLYKVTALSKIFHHSSQYDYLS